MIMHKVFFQLQRLQLQWREFVTALKNVQAAIIYVHDWIMWYKEAPLTIVKMMKPQAKLEKEKVRVLIQNNKQLATFITNTQDAYSWFYNSLDLILRTHKIPSVSPITHTKSKHQVWQEIGEFLEKQKKITTNENFEINR